MLYLLPSRHRPALLHPPKRHDSDAWTMTALPILASTAVLGGVIRWRFRLFLVPCCGLCLATIYLRYHYLTDVLVGFGLAALALWLTGRWAHHAAALGWNSDFSNHQPETNP